MDEQRAKLEKKRAQRGNYLIALYDITDGNKLHHVNMTEVGGSIGISRTETDNVVQYLVDEGLVEYTSLGGGIAITHYGVLEIEEARVAPTEPTEHFPPLNVFHIGSMVGSNIIQNSTVGHAGNITVDVKNDLSKFVEVLAGKVSQIDLTDSALEEIQADIDTLKAQLKLANPKKGIIQECLSSVRTILEGVASSTIATGLLLQLDAVASP